MTAYADSHIWQDVYHARFGETALYIKFTVQPNAQYLLLSFKRVSENSVLGVARLQAPCSALPSIAGSQGIRLLRAPGSGRFRSDFGLRVNFQTLSKER